MLITANIATYPKREHLLDGVLNSIAPFVDLIRVYWNEYDTIPQYVKNYRVESVIGQPNLGDLAKFYWAHKKNEYYFTMDDDLLYPPSYIQDHLKVLKQYKDQVLVTLHGRILRPPIKDFYKDYEKAYHCLWNVKEDVFVNIGGTGVMCFNTNVFRVNYKFFAYPNMADCWIAKTAQEQQIPILVRKHEAGYLTDLIPNNEIETIYVSHSENHEEQNEVINSLKQWFIYTPKQAIILFLTLINEALNYGIN